MQGDFNKARAGAEDGSFPGVSIRESRLVGFKLAPPLRGSWTSAFSPGSRFAHAKRPPGAIVAPSLRDENRADAQGRGSPRQTAMPRTSPQSLKVCLIGALTGTA